MRDRAVSQPTDLRVTGQCDAIDKESRSDADDERCEELLRSLQSDRGKMPLLLVDGRQRSRLLPTARTKRGNIRGHPGRVLEPMREPADETSSPREDFCT